MTIYDISAKAGVSIATVSRVLNGSPKVSECTRQKVLDVMQQYGYTPNVFARGLGLHTMKTIGIMCADSSDLYLAKAIYYLEQQLRSNGYNSILSCTGYDLKNKMSSMDLLLSKKVDGIILVGSNFVYEKEKDNQYIANASSQVPVMVLNADLSLPNVYCVLLDDYTSMYEATNQLISDGITDLLYFYNSNSYSGKRKLKGFQAALKNSGLSLSKDQLQFFPGSLEDIPGMVKHLLKLHSQGISFSGVVASDDSLALAAVKYAGETGLSVPKDLSVIGYNNSMLVHCCDPELTSIDNKLEHLCRHLTQTLMGVLGGNDMPGKIIFPGELIKRGTTLNQ